MYPEWDPGMSSGRGGGLLDSSNLSAGLLGAAPMSSAQSGGGMSSSWGGGGSGGKNQLGQNKLRSRVVVVKYDRRPLSNKTLFAFTEPFGCLREHLVLRNKAFLEMNTHEEAQDMVNYYEQHQASLYGKPIVFYLSKRLLVIEKDEGLMDSGMDRSMDRGMDRPVRDIKGSDSQVVFFSNLPREEEKKMELLTIAGRFGVVQKHLFLTDQAFVQLGTPEDAEMLVKYYSVNPLTIKGRPIRLNVCTKYKTLNVNRRQVTDSRGTRSGGANTSSSGSGTRTSANTSRTSSSKSPSSSRSREERKKKEKKPEEKPAEEVEDEEEVSGVMEGEDGGEEETEEQEKQEQEKKEQAAKGDAEVEEPEGAESVKETMEESEEVQQEVPRSDDVTDDTPGDAGGAEGEAQQATESEGRAETEASAEEHENREEPNSEPGASSEGDISADTFDQDFLENMEDFVTLDEVAEDDEEADAESDTIDSTRAGGMRVVNIVGFRRGYNYLNELQGLAKPFGKVVKHLVLDLRPEAYLQFATEEEARAMAKFYNSNVTASVCGRPVRVSHSSYPTIQCGSSKVVYIGQLPHSDYTDDSVLKLAEPFGRVRKYFLNRIKREGFIEMDKAEEAEKMAEDCKENPPKFNGKRLTVYVSRKYKQLKHGHRCPGTSKRENSSSTPKSSKHPEEPPAKKPKEQEKKPEPEEKEKEKEKEEEEEEKKPEEEEKEEQVEDKKEEEMQSCDDEKREEISETEVCDQNQKSSPDEVTQKEQDMESSTNQNGQSDAPPPAEIRPSMASLPLPPYDPDTPIGVEHVKMGYYCRVCFLFYSNEETAKKTHCSSQTHYDKLQKHLEKEQAKAEKKKGKKTTA